MKPLLAYKKAIADYLNTSPDQVSLYWKGRVGLYAILKALEIGEGDEILLPGYTCVVVPNAILYTGAKPIYIDIDPQTYNIDVSKIEAHITPQTKAILIQNTFGLSPDIDAIKKIVKRYSLKIIEDNTHGFGSTYQGIKSGLHGDAAFFSSQWNKTFSTGVGGFVVANDPDLIQQLKAMEETLIRPSSKAAWMLQQQIYLRKKMANSRWYWPAVNTYRWLSKNNLISGSSKAEELISVKMPTDFWMGLSEVQAKEGLLQLSRFADNLKNRRLIAAYYQEAFLEMQLNTVFEPDYAHHIFLKYAFFVKDKNRFLELATRAKIPLGDWLASPIHPVEENWQLWQYQKGTCPVSEKVSRHILNLPTDPDIDEKEAQRIVQFLKENRTELIPTP